MIHLILVALLASCTGNAKADAQKAAEEKIAVRTKTYDHLLNVFSEKALKDLNDEDKALAESLKRVIEAAKTTNVVNDKEALVKLLAAYKGEKKEEAEAEAEDENAKKLAALAALAALAPAFIQALETASKADGDKPTLEEFVTEFVQNNAKDVEGASEAIANIFGDQFEGAKKSKIDKLPLDQIKNRLAAQQ